MSKRILMAVALVLFVAGWVVDASAQNPPAQGAPHLGGWTIPATAQEEKTTLKVNDAEAEYAKDMWAIVAYSHNLRAK